MSLDVTPLAASVDHFIARTQNAEHEVVEGQKAAYKQLSDIKPVENPWSAVAKVGKTILATVNIGAELTNTGVAVMTTGLAAVLPMFPAAQLGSLYIGVPHAHSHPPSLVPPAPPIPLPSIGAITLGTCAHVLISGVPAARVGDLGLAPTCGGLVPFFEVFLGSSKVFIGGARAARQTDFGRACCAAAEGAPSQVAKALKKAGDAVAAMGVLGSVSDANHDQETASSAQTEAESEEAAASASANSLSAAMAVADLASDAVKTALSKVMGSDPGMPPGMLGVVMQGAPNVVVAGFPLPNINDPVTGLLEKLRLKGVTKWRSRKRAQAGGGGGCGG